MKYSILYKTGENNSKKTMFLFLVFAASAAAQYVETIKNGPSIVSSDPDARLPASGFPQSGAARVAEETCMCLVGTRAAVPGGACATCGNWKEARIGGCGFRLAQVQWAAPRCSVGTYTGNFGFTADVLTRLGYWKICGPFRLVTERGTP